MSGRSKTCPVIGAGEGLGTALSARLARGGQDLVLVSHTESGSAEAVESAKDASDNVDVRFRSADANRPDTIRAAFGEVGPIDVLIYDVRDVFVRCAP